MFRERTPGAGPLLASPSAWRGLYALCLAALAVGCNGAGDPTTPTCPNDLPSACPGAPSYANEIAPLIEARCFPCHASGGEAGPNWLLTDHANVFAKQNQVLKEVYACVMPPSGAKNLEASERAALLAWLVCEAPDN